MRNCFSLPEQRSTVLHSLYRPASKAAGRPPARPRLRRWAFWSSSTGDDGLDPALAQVSAVGRGGVRLVAHHGPGPSAGPPRPWPGDADGLHQRDEPRQSPCWPGLRIRTSGRQRRSGPGGSRCSARRGSGPAPPGPALLTGSCHSAMPIVARSAGRARRAPAACWCARTMVESALTVRSFPSALSHPAAGRPGSSPRSRPSTSSDAGYRRSSSSDSPAGHATNSLPGPEEDPADPPSGWPAGHPEGGSAGKNRRSRFHSRSVRS